MSSQNISVSAKLRHLIALRRRPCCCYLLMFSILTTLLMDTHGIRAKRSGTSFFSNDNDDGATIRTEYVDKNNQTILDMFNLTRAQLSRITADRNSEKKEAGAAERDTHFFEDIKEHRINDIKNRLNRAFQGGTSEESQEHPLHEMAAYPICNSESNESSWLHDNNVTIRFSDSLFEPKRDNLNLDSAILRLYKVNPNGLTTAKDDANVANVDANVDANVAHLKQKRCTDPLLDAQIRITVSTVQQLRRNKRERKKRICNTMMMNVSHTGWVEIDIKRAIQIWERHTPISTHERQQLQQQLQQQQQQHHHQPQPGGRQPILVGWLMIEVHDEEERPLKPGLFFKPPKCDQADLAIPWNYYGPHASMSSTAADEVPRSPRLDVKLIGYASFAPKQLLNKHLHDQLHLNLRRQLYRSQNSAEFIDDSTTTNFTPSADNLVEASASTDFLQRHRKRHAHHQSSREREQEQEQSNNNDEQSQYSSTLPTVSDVEKLQHQRAHHRQYRQHKHHNHHQYQHQHHRHHHQHQQEQQHSQEERQQHSEVESSAKQQSQNDADC